MSMADYDFSEIDEKIAAGAYFEAEEKIEKENAKIYSSHDNLLYALDRGLLFHYAKDEKKSNEFLSEAEHLIERYYARSISQTITSALTNDLAQDYSGEDSEDIYTNLFKALNYLSMKKNEDAFVEVRRMGNKIRLLEQKYEKTILSESEHGVNVEKVSSQFSDSALARYISLLLYRADGDDSNALIDKRAIEVLFASKKLYDFPIPSSISSELSVPKEMARLNTIAFCGRSPIKKEQTTRIYYERGGIFFKLALPEMEKIPSKINRVTIEAKNLKNGKKTSATAEKIESIEEIFLDTFKRKYSVSKAKSLARAITRAATSTTMDVLSAKSANEENYTASFLFSLMGLFTKAYTEGVERADTRICRYFPASALVSGINVEAGTYEVTVSFFSGNKIVSEVKKEIEAKAGDVNLVEAYCLK